MTAPIGMSGAAGGIGQMIQLFARLNGVPQDDSAGMFSRGRFLVLGFPGASQSPAGIPMLTYAQDYPLGFAAYFNAVAAQRSGVWRVAANQWLANPGAFYTGDERSLDLDAITTVAGAAQLWRLLSRGPNGGALAPALALLGGNDGDTHAGLFVIPPRPGEDYRFAGAATVGRASEFDPAQVMTSPFAPYDINAAPASFHSSFIKRVNDVTTGVNTPVLDIAVPIDAQAARVRATVLYSVGAGGPVNLPGEASRVETWDVLITRAAGLAAVATLAEQVDNALSVNVAGGTSVTDLGVTLNGPTGAAGDPQAYALRVNPVTVDPTDPGTVVVRAEILNLF